LIDPQRLRDILSRSADLPLVVLGDFIADRYVLGSSGRVSREAPVLILRFLEEKTIPGGAANAAMNMRALGAPVRAVGVVGADRRGEELLALFRQARIDVDAVLVSGDRATTVKTRILAGDTNVSRQQVVRIDRDQPDHLGAELERWLAPRLERALEGSCGLLLSDYGQGVLAGSLRALAIEKARALGIPCCADSRHRLDLYRGVTTATPNISEVLEILPVDADSEPEAVGRALLEHLQAESAIITRGSAGMEVHLRGKEMTRVGVIGGVEVIDVTGAGDTVAATVTLTLAAGGTAQEAAELASHAAGIVVNKRGTAVASAEEVARSLSETWDVS